MKSVRGDGGIQGETQYAECGGKLKRSKASYGDGRREILLILYETKSMHNHGKKVIKKMLE
jgi:hypothetical protein